METIFGLPAHPLFVHAAVVIPPLVAIALVVMSWAPGGRRFARIGAAAAWIAAGIVLLTANAGEALEERVAETQLLERHADMGEMANPWVVGLAILATIIALEPQIRQRRASVFPVLGTVLSALVTIAALGSTYSIIKVGHSGAEAVWDGKLSNAPAEGGEEGENEEGEDEEGLVIITVEDAPQI